MKRLFKAFIMSLSMFSSIPMPLIWEEKLLPLVAPNLPFVGAIIGVFWAGCAIAFNLLGTPLLVTAAILLLIPLFLSGFIHIDGLMDTSDAIFSRAPLPKKLAILKDSHVGAFAVIALGCYFLLGFTSLHSVISSARPVLLTLVLIPIASRTVAAFAMLNINSLSEVGFVASFKRDAKPIHTMAICVSAFLCIAAAVLLSPAQVLPVIGTVFVAGALAALFTKKQLGGISGDLCGFIITVSELCALVVWALL